MKNHFSTLLSGLMLSSCLIFSPIPYAEPNQNQEQEQATTEQSYGDKVSEKATNGIVNMTTSTLEIPKSIINVSNESNIAYGFIGGTVLGILNTVGRLMTGMADLATAFIPTEPSIYPNYVWDDFDADTTYGKTFRLDNQTNDTNLQQEKH